MSSADRFLPFLPVAGPDRPIARPAEAGIASATAPMDAPADPLLDALDAAACLGAWLHDPSADRVSVSSRFGEVLGLAPGERAGMPLGRLLSGLDPEDRPRIATMLDAVQATGGPFETELRLAEGPSPGSSSAARSGRGVRLLRLMGRAGTDAAGRPRTCGLAFELTEMRLGRGSPPLRAQWQLNQLAGQVIAMKGLVAALDSPALARTLDRLAIETGIELARRLARAKADARH